MKDLKYAEDRHHSIKAATFYVIDKMLAKGDVNQLRLACNGISSGMRLSQLIKDIKDELVTEACRSTANNAAVSHRYLRHKGCSTLSFQMIVVNRTKEYERRRALHMALYTDGGLGANRGLR